MTPPATEAATAATPRRGRPGKGKRHGLMSRVPEDLANEVMSEAKARGLTCSDYIAVVLAEKHEFPLPKHHYPHTDGSVQEEMSMPTAS